MKGQSNYVPPAYVPLGQSDLVSDVASHNEDLTIFRQTADGKTQWSSGLCACCDDIQSCCIGLVCPCYLFGKNAEFLGSGTLVGSCMTHFLLWTFMNIVCCFLSNGVLLGLPGCFVACYACGFRRELRSKYNLQEGPCRDLVTHICCHLCAICQEYREIHDRTTNMNASDLDLAVVTAPPIQTMESAPLDGITL